ncbi:MAG: hydrogenase maturation nickel metallochaperone HypA [Dehalococcoidales bacterium]|nr:hydrogenase maturation nickel metallochaperone HypA [Dehalococcoidales bacterium]
MHELSITQSMFDLVLEQAKQASAQKVVSINLVIGEMTGVVGDSVQFYLELLSKGTIAEEAKLNIKSVPAKAKCQRCSKEFDLPEYEWTCPECKGDGLEITGGTELFLESIEVE